MGLSLSGGYAEQDFEVKAIVEDVAEGNERGVEEEEEKKAIEDGFGLDSEEKKLMIAQEKGVKRNGSRRDGSSWVDRKHYREKDPELFELLEELRIKAKRGRSPLDLILELLAFCGPRHDFYPRIDHFVMRILDEERQKGKDEELKGPVNKKHETLLHLACKNLSPGLVHFLADDFNVDVNALTLRRRNALHITLMASSGQPWVKDVSFVIAEILLRIGTEPNAQDSDLKTPLHLAASLGDSTLLGLMLLYGADPSHEDRFGLKPVVYAMRNEHLRCVSLLHTDSHWREYQDRKTGRLFYINSLTNEQTMERPANVKKDFSSVVHRVQELKDLKETKDHTQVNNPVAPSSTEQAGGHSQDEQVIEVTKPSELRKPTTSKEGEECESDYEGERLVSDSSSSKGSGSELFRRASSLLRMRRFSFEQVRGGVQERVRVWREIAWREGVRRTAQRKQEASLRALEAYKRNISKEKSMDKKQIEQLRMQLDQVAQSKDLTADQLASLREELAKEQEEKTKLLDSLVAAQMELELAQKQVENAEREAMSTRELTSQLEALHQNLQVKEAENERLRRNFMAEQLLRRKTHNKNMDLLGAIRVYCRIRPLSASEREACITEGVEAPAVVPGVGMDLDTALVPSKNKSFHFDATLGPDSTQDEVFSQVEPLVQSAIDGYNVCIFAYGQTGSGKSFTMFGPHQGPKELLGIAPRSIDSLFQLLESRKQAFTVSCWGVELYNNQLRDLMSNSSAKVGEKLTVKKDSSGTVVVENAVLKSVKSRAELLQHLFEMQAKRKVSSTNMNAESSRSHLIFTILIETVDPVTKSSLKGKLTLVDLAGSEKVAKSGVSGQGLKEAVAINQSLTALGDVISALTENKSFIPYRNHLLTQLMADVLGGNAKTLMIVNVSPVPSSVPESLNSMLYATRVKKIKNNAKKNVETEEIRLLRKQIDYLRSQGERHGIILDMDFMNVDGTEAGMESI